MGAPLIGILRYLLNLICFCFFQKSYLRMLAARMLEATLLIDRTTLILMGTLEQLPPILRRRPNDN